jgi:hypothetical protein
MPDRGGAGPGHTLDGGHDLLPSLELRLLTRRRLSADDPGAPEVRTVATVGDADVGPQHVTFGQLALGGKQRQGQVAVRGPHALSLARRHHLPDRFEHARRGPQFEGSPQKACRQVDLADAGGQSLVDFDHRLVGDPDGGSEAGQFVRGFDHLCGADNSGRIGGSTVGEQRLRRARHGAGGLIDRNHGPGGDQFGQNAGEVADSFVELEIHRAMQVIRGQLRLVRGALAKRQEQMRPFVVGDHHGDRPLDVGQTGVPQRPAGPGGVDHRAVAEQDHRINTALGHRRAQPGPCLATHAGQVRRFGNHQAITGAGARLRDGCHYSPKKLVMLPLTMRAAFCGPTASTTAASDFSE